MTQLLYICILLYSLVIWYDVLRISMNNQEWNLLFIAGVFIILGISLLVSVLKSFLQG